MQIVKRTRTDDPRGWDLVGAAGGRAGGRPRKKDPAARQSTPPASEKVPTGPAEHAEHAEHAEQFAPSNDFTIPHPASRIPHPDPRRSLSLLSTCALHTVTVILASSAFSHHHSILWRLSLLACLCAVRNLLTFSLVAYCYSILLLLLIAALTASISLAPLTSLHTDNIGNHVSSSA